MLSHRVNAIDYSKNRIILGIDPGSCITGYGLIQMEGSELNYLDSGCIKVVNVAFSERLEKIFTGLQKLLQDYTPHEAAIEQVFMHINPHAALKLGQARGVALVAAALAKLRICEYSARQVKQSVVGYGAASKQQVQHMVRVLLDLNCTPSVDAADALAIAICHAQARQSEQLGAKTGFRRGRRR
ncbi:crossover junction endodeoxyribonuclease RuvC [Rickettsiella grylli]|uniref:crossover junction endodeoxyribonuclease RuvC n=1 Tax=Rickettsiella grylli TaxID=59196 RepID=UPI0008FCEC8D|nr:crossover junction endodeoxyribonuclease RuvC [Rickettsiella grylli]